MSKHITYLSYLASPTLWLQNMNSYLVDAPLSNLVELLVNCFTQAMKQTDLQQTN